MKLLVTVGAGFIGSNFVRYMLQNYGDYQVTVLDKLTYAGNPEKLRDLTDGARFRFVRGDIADADVVDPLVASVDAVVSFAAETHVERSILECRGVHRDPCAGDLGAPRSGAPTWARSVGPGQHRRGLRRHIDGASVEGDPLVPRSPYAASKAAGDLMVLAYRATCGLPVLITSGSNTIGPHQYPEKVVPPFVTNAIDDLPLPIYGDGGALRDYIYVMDQCRRHPRRPAPWQRWRGLQHRRRQPGRYRGVGPNNPRAPGEA